MNYSPTNPFTLVYSNAGQLSRGYLSAWQTTVSAPHFDPSSPSSPLLYVMVETGRPAPQPGVQGWSCLHQPGPPLVNAARKGGGGISLLYHSSCPVKQLPTHSHTIPATLSPHAPPSSAVLCAIVQPHHCKPFLLAAVYLQPHTGSGGGNAPARLQALTSRIDAASAAHPSLPLLVVGDFNCHHPDWRCPSAIANPTTVTQTSRQLAGWVDSFPLDICNPLGKPTRIARAASGAVSRSVIDLALCSVPLLVSVVTQEPAALQTDHLPFTIMMDLPALAAAARPLDNRPRHTWNHHENPSVWQDALPQALTDALTPIQPLLLALTQPVPSTATAQQLLDTAYAEFERVFVTTCLQVVDTKVVRPWSNPWWRYPGIREAYAEHKAAANLWRHYPNSLNYDRYHTARQAWAKISAEAKLQSYSDLCEQVMQPDDRLRWKLFKRTAPSVFTSLSAISHPTTNNLPTSHSASLDNLCTAFLNNGVPPPPSNQADYDALHHQVEQWAHHASPSIPAHASDAWAFTAQDVERQCTTQHTNTAPGPDAILPVFLAHAGDAAWTALATLYTFSWQHAVLPQAWREANVMALYKGDDGVKSDAGSYRPISMTSIIIRTLEHLIHHRLSADLDQRGYYSPTQFGYRKQHSTEDAIHYLLSGLQRWMRTKDSDDYSQQCPVLFLDISKAFDRVDHSILLQRVHAAGIQGKAWLWLKAFLSGRTMRCVDASEHSTWQAVPHGVPQGCVLSPLLFLIFINQLLLDISSDPACDLLAPLFFADDGAIGPDPLAIANPAAADFAAAYEQQLRVALGHLQRWCDSSRMLFGAKKTQLVLFTTRQRPDTTAYANLNLCGFTIQLSTSYLYLGLHLDHRLSWTEAQQSAITKARIASARVTRVALRASEVSFAAVRSLILGYLIPTFTYGILFWGRDADLTHNTRRRLQGHITRPIRVALHLPRTTHQTGTLMLGDVPSMASVTLRAQLSFLRRVCGSTAVLPADHPTRLLHKQAITLNTGRQPYTIMAASNLTPLSVYLCASVYPRLLNDPAMQVKLDAPTASALTPHGPCAEWQRGVTYWTQVGRERRDHAQRTGYTLQHMRTAVDWTSQSAQHLTPDHINAIRRHHQHAEWEAEHETPPPLVITPTQPPPQAQRNAAAAAPAPPQPPQRPHTTTAPLTRCKPGPGLPPFLSHRSKSSHSQRILRARFLMGRACTGAVRLRFAKRADRHAIDAHCTDPTCQPAPLPAPAPAPTIDTIEHALLHCQRHHKARQQLRQHLHPLQLSMSTILIAHPPPPPFRLTELDSLLHYTASFLAIVETERLTAGLVPLDTG